MQFVSASAFYEKSMEVLNLAGIPFLVGGAYAFRAYAGIVRDTKDFDLMIRRRDLDGALSAFRSAGFRADVLFPHWIAKVHYGESFIDIIFNSGNGLCPVDEAWVRACAQGDRARAGGGALSAGGNHLAKGLYHGARALRRRGTSRI